MGWNPPDAVKDHHWQVPDRSTKHSQAFEQDCAAGGRDHRVVNDSAGALGRVVLQRRYRRLYAELRWTVNKKPCSLYLREVTSDSRSLNLTAGWKHAHDLGLTVASNPAAVEHAGGHQHPA